MAIAEADKRAIDEAVASKYYVETDKTSGAKFIEMFADYDASNDFLKGPAYDMRKDAMDTLMAPDERACRMLDELKNAIDESYQDTRIELEDEVMGDAGFDPVEDEVQLDYLRDEYPFIPPYDHFLDQTMHVNIMLQTPEEANSDFTIINSQYLALTDSTMNRDTATNLLSQDSSLKRLVEQQGFTMGDLASAMQEYKLHLYDKEGYPKNPRDDFGNLIPLEAQLAEFNKTHSPFLTSVCQELENQTYEMGTLTILANMSMKEFAEMMQPGKEVTMPKNSEVGIFNPWNGSGSVLEVELAKDFTFRSDDIYDIQIEGVQPDFGYTVNNVYGLVGSCWKEPVSVKDPEPERKPSLDSMIASAAQRSGQTAGDRGPTQGISF